LYPTSSNWRRLMSAVSHSLMRGVGILRTAVLNLSVF
jgi:hypothetical protein